MDFTVALKRTVTVPHNGQKMVYLDECVRYYISFSSVKLIIRRSEMEDSVADLSFIHRGILKAHYTPQLIQLRDQKRRQKHQRRKVRYFPTKFPQRKKK